MAELIYKGRKYTRNGSKWVDADCMVVHQTLQMELNEIYKRSLDFSVYSVTELIAEGDKFKESGSYLEAVNFYEKALDNADRESTAYILPRITSCYRKCHLSNKAISLFSRVKERFGEDIITPVLLTSAAAAYCDMHEYEKALICARRAYKGFDGKADDSLMRVFKRIDKETSGRG